MLTGIIRYLVFNKQILLITSTQAISNMPRNESNWTMWVKHITQPPQAFGQTTTKQALTKRRAACSRKQPQKCNGLHYSQDCSIINTLNLVSRRMPTNPVLIPPRCRQTLPLIIELASAPLAFVWLPTIPFHQQTMNFKF